MKLIKLFNGVYKLTFGTPEFHTPCSVLLPQPVSEKLNGLSDKSLRFSEDDCFFRESAQGCVIKLPIFDGEQIFGFGLQLRQFNHTGKKITIRNNADPVTPSGDSHAPVPFYVTNTGYGVLVDTARYASFYCGGIKKCGASAGKNRIESNLKFNTDDLYRNTVPGANRQMIIEIPVAKGADVYIFEGENTAEAVAKYNLFSGGGADVPEWGLGVWYRIYGGATSADVAEMIEQFKQDDIPLSVLGLEPGWQTHAYSCTYKWDPSRMAEKEAMFAKAEHENIRLNLWEHAFVHPDSDIYGDILPYCGDYEVWGGAVPDFTTKEAKNIFGSYHKSKLIDEGISGFKLDECDGSDFTGGWSYPNSTAFPSGMDGEQMHSLFGMLYMKTILDEFHKDDKKTYGLVRSASAFAAPYPFVLYSDLYRHDDFIRGVVNCGFSGLLWTPELRDASSVKDLIRRTQSLIFSPQCLINAWYIRHTPWFNIHAGENVNHVKMENSEEVTAMMRRWLKLRMELVPYFKEAFDRYRDTGRPPFRALVLDYPSDPEVYQIDSQYLAGENYLVAPLTAAQDTRKVYIPDDGVWKNYFTGDIMAKGWHDITCDLDSMPLFIKI